MRMTSTRTALEVGLFGDDGMEEQAKIGAKAETGNAQGAGPRRQGHAREQCAMWGQWAGWSGLTTALNGHERRRCALCFP